MTRERFASIVVWTHLAVVLAHAAAHGALRVGVPTAADGVFILAAVYVGPLVSLVLLRGDHRRSASATLALSMAGALAYGVAYHYLLSTPDHVSHAPATGWGGAFRATALAIAVLEAAGAGAGAALWRRRAGARGAEGRRMEPRMEARSAP